MRRTMNMINKSYHNHKYLQHKKREKHSGTIQAIIFNVLRSIVQYGEEETFSLRLSQLLHPAHMRRRRCTGSRNAWTVCVAGSLQLCGQNQITEAHTGDCAHGSHVYSLLPGVLKNSCFSLKPLSLHSVLKGATHTSQSWWEIWGIRLIAHFV